MNPDLTAPVTFVIYGIGTHKIKAIKAIRTITRAFHERQLGLKDAKAVADWLEKDGTQVTLMVPSNMREILNSYCADNSLVVAPVNFTRTIESFDSVAAEERAREAEEAFERFQEEDRPRYGDEDFDYGSPEDDFNAERREGNIPF